MSSVANSIISNAKFVDVSAISTIAAYRPGQPNWKYTM